MKTDFFQGWKEELEQRREMRCAASNPADIVLSEADEVDLLLRAWFYSGRRYDFFVALFHNLGQMPVLKWLSSAKPAVLRGFLEFVPYYILKRPPHPTKLQFLINIYREELGFWYPTIIGSLDEEACQYLLTRTANAQLRTLFKEGLDSLRLKKRETRFGLSPTTLPDSRLNGLYGNKNQNLLNALDLIQSGRSRPRDLYSLGYWAHTLELVETVFNSGLVTDSLAILLDGYHGLPTNNNGPDLVGDTPIAKRFGYLLRKVIPTYAALEHLPAAAAAYQQVYCRYFPSFRTDSTAYYSLLMLDSFLPLSPHPPAAVRATLELWHYHLLEEAGEDNGRLFGPTGSLDFETLQKLVDSKKHAQPQEAFMLLQLALWLYEQGDFRIDAKQAKWILGLCRDFWTWVPNRLFFNAHIWTLLGPLLDPVERQAGERFYSDIQGLGGEALTAELKQRPDLLRKKDRHIARQLVAGTFLGVH